MNMTARIEACAPPGRTTPLLTPLSRVEVMGDLAAAQGAWRQLETADAFSTPFQRFDFLASWQRHVGAASGLEPCIVVGFDHRDDPLALVPLTVPAAGWPRVARFMGGKHPNFNMALWRRDFAATATRADLDALLKPLGRHADVLALTQQPQHWYGLRNPFALLPHQDCVNDCPLLVIDPAAPDNERVSGSLRRRLKTKERKLTALPGYRYARPDSAAEIARVLDAFFIMKPQRMALQKLPNVFAEAGVEAFVRDICDVSSGAPQVAVHALTCNDEVIAIFSGVEDGARFSMMFNTYTLSDNARHSPGLILIRHIIDHYAGRGYTSLDLGIGSAHYKTIFCRDEEPVFDSFIALNARGWPAATALALGHRAKYRLKQVPALTRLGHFVRARLSGQTAAD